MVKKICLIVISIVLVFAITSCGFVSSSKGILLNNVQYEERGYSDIDLETSFINHLSSFSNEMYEISNEDVGKNFTISPLSIFMALSILYEIGDENVKNDIKTLVKMSDEEISLTGELFKSLVFEREFDTYPSKDKMVAKLDLTNTVWLDDNLTPNQDALDNLAEKLFCHALHTPFYDDNREANREIRKFVKEKTKGLIDSDFDLSPSTLVALINTLYYKDFWTLQGLIEEDRAFAFEDGKRDTKFLYGKYVPGYEGKTANSRFFYSKTMNNFKLKLIIPKDGYTLADVMNKDNLNKINLFNDYDYKNSEEIIYETRCIFPSFKVSGDLELQESLAAVGYLPHAFTGYQSNLIKEQLFVSRIIHKAVVDVDKKGIEGAAVTIIANKATSIGPSGPEVVYRDFVVDKPFGFIITDKNDVVLFEGQVVRPN